MTLPANYVRQGAAAPETLQITITAGASGIDLTTVSAAVLHVKTPRRSLAWDTDIKSASTSTLVLTHTFVSDDTTDLGTYGAVPFLTVPTGIVRGEPITFAVVDQFAS